MKILTSWDDGYQSDLRIAELLEKYRLPGIFYLSNIAELHEQQITELGKKFEIGGHTLTHPEDMKRLNPEQQLAEVEGNREWLKELTGQELTSFAYPSGRYNELTIAAVQKAGFIEARTTLSYCTELPRDPWRIRPTIQARPDKGAGGDPWFGTAARLLEEALARGEAGYFHLWGHANDIDRFEFWKPLEDLLQLLAQHHNGEKI